jgi:hypothetical protein
MSTKTYFKRISLAVILALSFGALSSAPSQALLSNSAAVTVSAATDSKIALETSTVTITASFTSTVAGETFVVRVLGVGANGTDVPVTRISTSDSLNITAGASAAATTASTGVVLTASAADLLTRVKLTLDVLKVTNVGTHTYNVNLYSSTSGAAVALVAQTTYTVTVAAANTDATAAQSQIWLNQVLPSGSTYTQADSALVVSANQTPTLTLMTPTKVAYLAPNFRNSAGDSIVATTNTNVDGTMTVKITSGPGLLSKNSTDSTKARQFDIARGDSITIWNDGASGVTTITSYIGTTPLTQAAKTLTFYGKATAFAATANAVTARGWNLTAGSDSVTSGTAILTFVATDATALKVPSASQNRNEKFFLHSSDTKVVRGKQSATLGYGECTAPSSAADQTAGKWTCDMFVIDSGTVTLTVSDSMTIASSLYTSNEISVTVAGAAYKGAFSFAKTAVQTGENVLMTITCEDRAGRACGQKDINPVGYSGLFNSGGTQTKQFIGGYTTGDGVSTGTATFTTVYQWAGTTSFMGGTETALVTMPLTTGDVVIELTTGGTDALVVPTVTLVVSNSSVDAATAAANAATAAANAASAAAVAAAKAAQDAAVAEAQAAFDAASEAIDAANAATDAANLAAEAADAATVAAEEARDAADAATAAVEELATQVASLMAALRAQITTLANTVVKIAKKVKA